MRAHLMKPISSARSRKQRRQIMRPYLRMRPWCAPHTRLSAHGETKEEDERKREKKSFFFSSSSFSLFVPVRAVPRVRRTSCGCPCPFRATWSEELHPSPYWLLVFSKGKNTKKNQKKTKVSEGTTTAARSLLAHTERVVRDVRRIKKRERSKLTHRFEISCSRDAAVLCCAVCSISRAFHHLRLLRNMRYSLTLFIDLERRLTLLVRRPSPISHLNVESHIGW